MQWFCLYDKDGQHVANAHQMTNMTTIHQHPLPAGCGVFEVVAVIKPNVKLPHALSGEDVLCSIANGSGQGSKFYSWDHHV